MIPTRNKAKLPNTLSYPVGAETLSKALADAPNVEKFTVWFSAVRPSTEFQRLLREQLPYTILAAEYKPEKKPGYRGADFMIETGWFDAKWELHVYPVQRKMRRLAQSLLMEHGLPIVATWLRAADKASWLTVQHRIELVFSPTQEMLSTREIQ